MGLLTEALLRGLPTRDDRLQKDRVLILAERHQIQVVLASDDENTLAAVTLGVRVHRSPRSMWKTMSSNPMSRSVLSFAFFASSQSKYFTVYQSGMCAHKAHVGVGLSVPKSVPKRGPDDHHPAANANQVTNKKRA
jgi:hypothetical protein